MSHTSSIDSYDMVQVSSSLFISLLQYYNTVFLIVIKIIVIFLSLIKPQQWQWKIIKLEFLLCWVVIYIVSATYNINISYY